MSVPTRLEFDSSSAIAVHRHGTIAFINGCAHAAQPEGVLRSRSVAYETRKTISGDVNVSDQPEIGSACAARIQPFRHRHCLCRRTMAFADPLSTSRQRSVGEKRHIMKKTAVGAFLVLVVAVLAVGCNGNSSPTTPSPSLILSPSGQTTASPSSSVSPSYPTAAVSPVRAATAKWTLTVSPSTETVPAGSNCNFSITPTGSKSLTGVRVQISADISPKTAQTPDLRLPLYDIGINSGVFLYCTTGNGSKGTYTITATAKGIQYPIYGQTQTASATLIVN